MLVRGVHVQELPFMQRSINYAKNLVKVLVSNKFKMYANSHQFENHSCKSFVLTCRPRGTHANPGINEKGVQYVYSQTSLIRAPWD